MKELYWLAFILFVLLSLFCFYTKKCIKEGLSSLPTCNNNATCKDGSSKCDTYLSSLEKSENIPDKLHDKIDELNDYVNKSYDTIKKLNKQSKNCKIKKKKKKKKK